MRPFGVEEWLWRRDQRLYEAAVETAHRRTPRAVDLDLQQVIALNAARPGRADLCQYPVGELEGRKRVVLDIDFVLFVILVAAFRGRGRMTARHGFDLAQQPVEDVAPMGEHIEDETAARRPAVVPARALRRI